MKTTEYVKFDFSCSQNPSGHYMYCQFNTLQFLPSAHKVYLCFFRVDLRTNSDYFPIQH